MENQKGAVSTLIVFILCAAVVAEVAFVIVFYFRKNLPLPESLRETQQATQPTPSLPKKDETTVTTSATVSITKDGFLPQTIRVKRGSQITWVNNDTTPHTIAFDTNSSYKALENFTTDEPLSPNETISFTFEQAGTFTYRQTETSAFKGTVIVE